ncbi:MAG: PIN domain-containing protein [Actinobacteria bacterium]|nr:MAG: PIN domain-containing protein [Actinomycetota bacterium]RIK05350.1 MAG: VapC toxin family PIN domain ribonuclease [Acidobacteriota bacterium]
MSCFQRELVDANILLYAVDETSSSHEPARAWLEDALNGTRRVGIPWQSITAFLRIATNPRALTEALSPSAAWDLVEAWLDSPAAWIPQPLSGHREILGRLLSHLELRANLVSDAVLAALCLEHGLVIVSADSDFARFTEIEWHNPVRR